ncbi:MAG: IS4 family transposase [Betaproteobacteria bacterium]
MMAAQELEALVKGYAGSYRERLYPPLHSLGLFMGQALSADDACQDAVARNLSERTALGARACSLNTGPYCKARKRLPLALITALQRSIGARLEAAQPAGWRWRGRPVKLLDGTTVSMPDTKANQGAFPQSRSQKPGLGFPIARVVAIVSLGHGGVLDAAVGPCQGQDSSEQALVRQLLGAFEHGDLLLADSYHCTYWTIATLKSLGVDLLSALHAHRDHDFRCGKRLGKGDHVVQWKRPARPAWMDEDTYATMPETLTVRELRASASACWPPRCLMRRLLLPPNWHSSTPAAGTSSSIYAASKPRWAWTS